MKLTHVALALTILLAALTGYLFLQAQLDRKKVTVLERRVEEATTAQASVDTRIANLEEGLAQKDTEITKLASERNALATESALIKEKIQGVNTASPLASNPSASAGALQPLPSSPSSLGAPAALPGPGSLPPLGSPESVAAATPPQTTGNTIPNSTKLSGPQPLELTPLQQKVRDSGSIGDVEKFNQEWAFAIINAGSESGIAVGDEFAVRREFYVIAKVKVNEVGPNQSIANVVAGSLQPGIAIEAGDQIIHNPL